MDNNETTEREAVGETNDDWDCHSEYSHDGRHVLYYHEDEIRLVDTFHMKDKIFKWEMFHNCETLGYNPDCSYSFLKDPILIDSATVLGYIYTRENRTSRHYLVIGKLDYDRSICTAQHFLSVDEFCPVALEFFCFLKIVVLSDKIELLTFGHVEDKLPVTMFVSLKVNKQGIKLLEEPSVLPFEIFCPNVIDGFLYGFFVDSNEFLKPKELLRVCLKTREETILTIKSLPDVLPIEAVIKSGSAAWVGRNLIVNPWKPVNEINSSVLFLFNLDSLEWRKIDLRVENPCYSYYISSEKFFVAEINTVDKNDNFNSKLYRILIGTPDSLANISWLTIRKHTKKMPGFADYALAQLPKNAPQRCAF